MFSLRHYLISLGVKEPLCLFFCPSVCRHDFIHTCSEGLAKWNFLKFHTFFIHHIKMCTWYFHHDWTTFFNLQVVFQLYGLVIILSKLEFFNNIFSRRDYCILTLGEGKMGIMNSWISYWKFVHSYITPWLLINVKFRGILMQLVFRWKMSGDRFTKQLMAKQQVLSCIPQLLL